MPEEPEYQHYGVHFSIRVRDGAPDSSDDVSFNNVLKNSMTLQDDGERFFFVSLADQMMITFEEHPEVVLQDSSGNPPARELFLSRLLTCVDRMGATGLDILSYRWAAEFILPADEWGVSINSLIEQTGTEQLLGQDVDDWGPSQLTLMGLSAEGASVSAILRHTNTGGLLGVEVNIREGFDWSTDSAPDFPHQADTFRGRVRHLVSRISDLERR